MGKKIQLIQSKAKKPNTACSHSFMEPRLKMMMVMMMVVMTMIMGQEYKWGTI